MSARESLRLACALVVCCVAGALCAAVPAQALVVGIADQRASTFSDARLTSLPVRNAHLLVSWDAMRYRSQVADIDAWMAGAKAAGMSPLVTFGHSTRRRFSLPSAADYSKQIRAFRLRYPGVREYSPWNEPNIALHSQNSDPRKIASYYRVLRVSCPACKVLGADLVDTTNLGSWMRSYLHLFARAKRPRLWGLHNYVDVNSSSSSGTRTMLRVAPGQIWFTETGALIRHSEASPLAANDRRALIRSGLPRAVASTRRIFTLAKLSPRITRVYIYHWQADPHASWDSALVGPDGAPRPSFAVFAHQAHLAAGQP